MATVTGVVQAKSPSGICIDDVWYGDYKGMKTRTINKGDTVTLEWEPDRKTGKYKNITGIMPVVGGVSTGPSKVPSSYSAPYAPKSNLGVELGHAANLAMELLIKKYEIEGNTIGDDDFYKSFINHTDKIFKIMAALRKKKEAPPVSPAIEAYKDKEPLLESEVDRPVQERRSR